MSRSGFPQQPGHSSLLWTPTVQRFLVPPNVTIPLAPPRTFLCKVTLFAERSNSTFIAIGPSNMTVAVGAVPNAAQFQLDPGRDAEISTDDWLVEQFDLGNFNAAHNSAGATLLLYVTQWNVREI